MTDKVKNGIFYIACIVIVLAGFLLRLKMLIDNPSFWMDESALGYNILTLSIKDLFQPLHLQQVAPPLFCVITKIIINIFGAADINFRIFPFIIGNISMLIFLTILAKNFKNKGIILSGLVLFCFNTQMIKYSVEFKPYIIEIFITCLIMLIFWNLSLNQSYKKLFLIGCGLAITPWFAFISSLTLFFAYILNFSIKHLKKWICFFTPFVVSELIFIAYYANIRSFYSAFMTEFWNKYFLQFGNFLSELNSVLTFTFNTKLILIPIILCFAGIIISVRKKENLFIVNFFTLTLITIILLSYLKIYPFYERFLLFLYPLILMLIMICINEIFNKKIIIMKIITVILVIAILLPQIVFANQVISSKYIKNSCAREFMEYMVKNLKESDYIIVDNLSINDFLYYMQYYKINNKIVFPYEHKNNRIMYSSKPIKLTNEFKNYWFFSSYTKVNYEKLDFTYRKICGCNDGEVLFVKGLK